MELLLHGGITPKVITPAPERLAELCFEAGTLRGGAKVLLPPMRVARDLRPPANPRFTTQPGPCSCCSRPELLLQPQRGWRNFAVRPELCVGAPESCSHDNAQTRRYSAAPRLSDSSTGRVSHVLCHSSTQAGVGNCVRAGVRVLCLRPVRQLRASHSARSHLWRVLRRRDARQLATEPRVGEACCPSRVHHRWGGRSVWLRSSPRPDRQLPRCLFSCRYCGRGRRR